MIAEELRQIVEALAPLGFAPRLTADGLDFAGTVQAGRVAVPVRIRFDDLALASSPRFLIDDVSMLGRKVVPHLDERGEFCVVDRRAYVFDRHQAAGHTLGLIKRAAEVLERGMTRAGTDEIADEFPSYWSSSVVALPDDPTATPPAATPINAAHVTTAASLSFRPDQDRPETLGELIDWAASWDKELGPRITAALARLTATDPALFIHAANATVAAQVTVSAKGTTFAGTLRRPGAWARFLKTSAGRALSIGRHQTRRLDVAGILGAGGRPPLAGRRIALVGCGAIGGYLARALAQMGAGLEAPLILIDLDDLDGPNIRRHQLGMGDVRRPKAEACADAIGRDLPGIDVRPVVAQAQSRPDLLTQAELVIDATGEQEFNDWLNAWAIARRRSSEPCPATLFAWIAGHGWAAQTHLVMDGESACNRCLQPDLSQPARFDPLAEPVPEPTVACGDQPTTPYGPAASLAAASLAAAHVGDWAAGKTNQLLRTTRIDWERTVRRDPKNPSKAPNCPACGTT